MLARLANAFASIEIKSQLEKCEVDCQIQVLLIFEDIPAAATSPCPATVETIS